MNHEDYRAQKEWLRLNPHGMRAQSVRRALREHEREQQAQGVDVATLRAPTTLPHGFVAYHHDRPRQPLASGVVHIDRYCPRIAHVADEDMRMATAAERERLGPCGVCSS